MPHQVCVNLSVDPRVRVCVDTILEEIARNVQGGRTALLEYLVSPSDLPRVVNYIECRYSRVTVPLYVFA